MPDIIMIRQPSSMIIALFVFCLNLHRVYDYCSYIYSGGQNYSSTPMPLDLFANSCRKINYKRFRLVIFSNT